MIKICFLIVLLIVHAFNIPPECIQRKHVFQNTRAIYGYFSNSLQRKMIDSSCVITVKHLWKSLFSER